MALLTSIHYSSKRRDCFLFANSNIFTIRLPFVCSKVSPIVIHSCGKFSLCELCASPPLHPNLSDTQERWLLFPPRLVVDDWEVACAGNSTHSLSASTASKRAEHGRAGLMGLFYQCSMKNTFFDLIWPSWMKVREQMVLSAHWTTWAAQWMPSKPHLASRRKMGFIYCVRDLEEDNWSVCSLSGLPLR